MTNNQDKNLPENDAFLTTKEVADLLKISSRTLLNWRKCNKQTFPAPVCMGGVNRYSKAHINEWIGTFKRAA